LFNDKEDFEKDLLEEINAPKLSRLISQEKNEEI
jgi:hypothetical protein